MNSNNTNHRCVTELEWEVVYAIKWHPRCYVHSKIPVQTDNLDGGVIPSSGYVLYAFGDAAEPRGIGLLTTTALGIVLKPRWTICSPYNRFALQNICANSLTCGKVGCKGPNLVPRSPCIMWHKCTATFLHLFLPPRRQAIPLSHLSSLRWLIILLQMMLFGWYKFFECRGIEKCTNSPSVRPTLLYLCLQATQPHDKIRRILERSARIKLSPHYSKVKFLDEFDAADLLCQALPQPLCAHLEMLHNVLAHPPPSNFQADFQAGNRGEPMMYPIPPARLERNPPSSPSSSPLPLSKETTPMPPFTRNPLH